MQIPQSDILSTNAMNRVFDTTTATYKFYWLLALQDMYVKEQKDEMRALNVAARMGFRILPPQNNYGTREDKSPLPNSHQAHGFLCANAIPHAAQSAQGQDSRLWMRFRFRYRRTQEAGL